MISGVVVGTDRLVGWKYQKSPHTSSPPPHIGLSIVISHFVQESYEELSPFYVLLQCLKLSVV